MNMLQRRKDTFAARELEREAAFTDIWTLELNTVFADVAKYYDRATHFASLGVCNFYQSRFVSTIGLTAGQRVLDVCAGTNAVGIALLKKCPDLELHALDRSAEMQRVGAETARKKNLTINSYVGHSHALPFPDNHFDVVTLQWASRHLRLMETFDEVMRVLKPGGHFYHCDMLRPESKVVSSLYYTYLRFCLTTTAWLYRSNQAAQKCKKYFIDTLELFYSTDEITALLAEAGFSNIAQQSGLGGMIGYHKVIKPE